MCLLLKMNLITNQGQYFVPKELDQHWTEDQKKYALHVKGLCTKIGCYKTEAKQDNVPIAFTQTKPTATIFALYGPLSIQLQESNDYQNK